MADTLYYPIRLPDDSNYLEWKYENIKPTRPFCNPIRAYFHELGISHPMIGMHLHYFYEINIITEGEGRHYIGDISLPVSAGDVFIIPPGVRHGYLPKDRMVIFHLIISPAFMDEIKPQLEKLPNYALMFDVEPFLREVQEKRLTLHLGKAELAAAINDMNRLEELENCQGYTGQMMQKSYSLFFTSKLSDSLTRQQANRLTESDNDIKLRQVATCMEYINSHMTDSINTETLCHLVSMSPSSLYRAFRKVCGMPPFEYQMVCRVNMAKHLLRNTKRNILDISLSCGFYDDSHFIRTFKRIAGMTPASFRET